jgi:hypothetical protein
LKRGVPGWQKQSLKKITLRCETFRKQWRRIGQTNKVSSVTIPADMLEKIAAINHLAVVDVVRLFLAEALAKGDGKPPLTGQKQWLRDSER